MAVVSEGFSIREYTAKMREVDVEKCLPFSGGGGGGEAVGDSKVQVEETLLPPITVTKFRWWLHELNKINQEQEQDECLVGKSRNEGEENEEGEEKLEIVCPVCGKFAANSMKVVNAHVDSCLAHAQREEKKKMRKLLKSKSKSKSKSPKKRSILEIFAVSPLVDKVDDGDDDGKENKKKKVKSNKKKKIKKVVIENKLTMDKKKSKLNIRKKKNTKNKWMSLANKGNAHKLKLPVPVNWSRKVNSSLCNKGIKKAILDDVSVHQNKSGVKGSVQKKQGVHASKFKAKHQKAFIPVRGILKNYTKVLSQRSSEICNVSGGSQANCCELQYPDRHVRFSSKDDILGPVKNKFSSSDKNVFDTYPHILTNQSERDDSTESDTESDSVGVDGSGDIAVSIGNGTGFQTNINKKLPGMPYFPRLHKEKEQHILDIPSTSLHMFAHGYPLALNKPRHASSSRLLPTLNEAHNPRVNSQLCGNVTMASDSRGKSIDYFEDHTHGFADVDSLTSTMAFRNPSSYNFPSVERSNRSLSFMPQSSMTGQVLQNKPSCPLYPMGFKGPDRRQTVGAFNERGVDEEFVGLPLNSHGELIQASSSSRVCIDHLKKLTMLSSSSSSYPHNSVMSGTFGDLASEKHSNEQAVPNGQLNLLPVQKNHNVHLPGVAELPNTGRLDVYSLNSERGYPLDSYMSSMNTQCSQYVQSQNEKGTQMAHVKKNSDNMSLKNVLPTMRLMGKDVAVGRSNAEMQGFEDGNIWMDKEIIQEHCPSSYDDPGSSLLKRQIQQDRILHLPLENSRGSLHLPLEFESNQTSRSNFQMNAQEPRPSYPYFNWKTSSAFQNGDLAVNPDGSLQLHPSSLDMLYKGTNLQDSLISVAENSGISSQVPMMSNLQNTPLHMGWRPVESNYEQNLPNSRRSVFDFPFLHPDYNERIQPSSFSKNLPPWLVNASMQVKTATMPYQSFSDAVTEHHPCSTNGTDFRTPLHHQSVVYPHSSVISSPPLRGSLGSGLVKPPVFPFSTGIHPNSSINMSYRDKILVEDRMKSNALGVKLPNHFQKIKKRPAAMSGASLRPLKMPSLMQEDLSAVTGLTKETSSSQMWHNVAAYEPRSKCVKGIDLGCCSYEAQTNELGTSNDIDFSKADILMKAGPIKLTAGAKHILKPSRIMDHDDSRLIHSTIPFPDVTDCESFLDSQRKSTMIYRF